MVKRKKSVVKGKASKAARAEPIEAQADISGDDEVSSDDDAAGGDAGGSDEEEGFFETPDEKRVRLAKEYLSKLGEGRETADAVNKQLKEDVEEQLDRKKVQIKDLKLGEPQFYKGHKRAVTCLCMSADERTIYTGGKDCAILRWDVETGKKDILHGGGPNAFDCGGHFASVLAIALAGEQLVSGGRDRLLRFWDPRSPAKSSCTAKLHGHQGDITGLAAEADGSRVYSASADKSVKVWDANAKREVDTLFGHIGTIDCMDMYHKGRPLTGGADKTARLWKTDRDTHLMFSRHKYAVDAVSVLDHDRFLSGSQDGNIFLWSHASKKPLAGASVGSTHWVTALASIRRGNVFFSGSDDGMLRSWRIARDGSDDKALAISSAAEEIDSLGCINGIVLGSKILACAIGKEHRLGRWNYNKQARNGLLFVPLSYREE